MKIRLDLNTFIISLIKIWKGDNFKSFIFACTTYRFWIACGVFSDWCRILTGVPRGCSDVRVSTT